MPSNIPPKFDIDITSLTIGDARTVKELSIPKGGEILADPEAMVVREQFFAQNKHLTMKTRLINLLQEAVFARQLVKSIRKEILPEAKSILATYSKGYAAGRYSLLDLTRAQDALLQARLKVLDAAVEYQVKRNEIDRLTGGELARLRNREAKK